MLGNTRLLTMCASAALVLGAGCGSDGQTLAGLEPRFDQKGLGAGGHPEIFRFKDVFDFVAPEGTECPFAIQVVGQNRVIVQVFETHLVIHNNYKATITNLATGFAYTDNSAWMEVLHFNELGDLETVTVIGGFFHITIPGQGIVAHDTGIITFNPFTGEVLFEGGPHENFYGTAPGTCDLLSGGDV
jgi:hypothetical protein